jgi:hypothetical protein
MKHINSFKFINIIDNSLIIIDIDNTIFKNKVSFDKLWWRLKYEQYFNISHDHNLANNFVFQNWIELLKKNPPELLDSIYLFEFLNNAKKHNCNIVLLTARNTYLEQITLFHIKYFGIDKFIDDVYFNIEKGPELLKISQKYMSCKNIIIVDDLYENILDMQKAFIKASYSVIMHCHLIDHNMNNHLY